MKKAEFIDLVQSNGEYKSKADAEHAVNTFIDSLRTAFSQGEGVSFTGFGTFQVKTRAPREGRNPKTGEAVQIPETTSVGFKVGKNLKEELN